MKVLGIGLTVGSIVFCICCLVWGGIYCTYFYNVKVGQYVELADDASTPERKLEYLTKYTEKVKEHIRRNEARFIFKKERLTRDAQLKILDTLIQRLKDTTQLKSDNFAYQQAMLQITGQEFDHALDNINAVFRSCWLRQSAFAVFCLWFWWIWLITLMSGLGVCANEYNW